MDRGAWWAPVYGVSKSWTRLKRLSMHIACTQSVISTQQWVKMGFPDGSDGKESTCNAGDWSSIPGWEDPLEKEMATHLSILAWKIPGTEEPGRLQSMGSQRVND